MYNIALCMLTSKEEALSSNLLDFCVLHPQCVIFNNRHLPCSSDGKPKEMAIDYTGLSASGNIPGQQLTGRHPTSGTGMFVEKPLEAAFVPMQDTSIQNS